MDFAKFKSNAQTSRHQKPKVFSRGFTVLPIMLFILSGLLFLGVRGPVTEQIVDNSSAPKAVRPQISAFRTSFPVSLSVDSNIILASAEGGTVADLLDQQGIALNPMDYTRPTQDTELEPGMTITVIRVRVETKTEEIAVPFETVRTPSKYIMKGSEAVKQEGIEGKATLTYDVTYENGIVASRTEPQQTVTVEPTNQIIEYGSGGVITTPDGRELQYVKVINVKATAYTTENAKNKITATGTIARVGAIAVDPKVIPLGTAVYVTSRNGTSWIYGEATAEDVGGAIKGNIIDLFFDTRAECFEFGVKKATVYILASE